MRTLLRLTPLLLLTTACLRTPPPNEHALQNADQCVQYLDMKDIERAQIHCELALQFAPQWAVAHLNMGLVHYTKGDSKAAREAYVRALRHDPNLSKAHNNIGVIYRDEKNLGRAHDSFQRALKIDPNALDARYNLALTLKQMGRNADARKEYKTLLAIQPTLADPYNDMGIMDFEESAYQSAAENFARAVQLSPEWGAPHQGLGSSLMELGRYEECAAAYSACIDVDPNNITCRQNITVCNRKAALATPVDNATSALKACSENSAPEEAAACHYAQAQKFGAEGLRVEQEKALKQCAAENPRFALCHFDLFLLFREDRQERGARTACANFMRAASREEFPERFEDCDRFMASGTF